MNPPPISKTTGPIIIKIGRQLEADILSSKMKFQVHRIIFAEMRVIRIVANARSNLAASPPPGFKNNFRTKSE